MKTAIKTLIASTLTAIVLTSSAFTTFAKEKSPSNTVPVKFNKIVVTGNANVVLVQGNNETVSSDDMIEQSNTSVKQKGYTLYINSTDKSTIYVHVKDLQRIDAANSATVKTRGNFDLALLQIFLKDDAKAKVNATVGSLYTNLSDQSDLKLSGSSSEHKEVSEGVSKLNQQDFVIAKL
ncbi:GIN domain-containing protein [Pedobacter gandavensis]|uniref:Putative auto-transporter adhesin head GIN domain-containing protein n=1 Tax=Pedobacter gandavensis TaxID=2679963 RepID=A0ABR6EYB4_9SPHI|nr:DUF2807 domain-containing protein [Pedobacter gandavensis]MBB2149834.1 hypothetical protein [Pedobacter gandavensis]